MIAPVWSKFLPSGSHLLSPKPQIFLTACSTVSLGQFDLIDGVSYVMGGRVGICDTHCGRLEDLTPPHLPQPHVPHVPHAPSPPHPKHMGLGWVGWSIGWGGGSSIILSIYTYLYIHIFGERIGPNIELCHPTPPALKINFAGPKS